MSAPRPATPEEYMDYLLGPVVDEELEEVVIRPATLEEDAPLVAALDRLTADTRTDTMGEARRRTLSQAIGQAARNDPSAPLTTRVGDHLDPATREKLERIR